MSLAQSLAIAAAALVMSQSGGQSYNLISANMQRAAAVLERAEATAERVAIRLSRAFAETLRG
ncbi:MAG: hypothetical protein DCF16_03495 [Alphaproteobacteria bacterium]|nr:MAG: hypothetical protein DCF16_03495 [Alphaproteobacteria bacterium]